MTEHETLVTQLKNKKHKRMNCLFFFTKKMDEGHLYTCILIKNVRIYKE